MIIFCYSMGKVKTSHAIKGSGVSRAVVRPPSQSLKDRLRSTVAKKHFFMSLAKTSKRGNGQMSHKKDAVVITGGLGYVGQSLAATLQASGEQVILIDVRHIPSQVAGVPTIHGSIGDHALWEAISQSVHIKTIYHCAGLIVVSESTRDPARYFQENVCAALSMLDYLRKIHPVPMVFSSSAAVYGVPKSTPIAEDGAKAPISPYGVTKWEFEQILAAYNRAYGQPYVALRYFNVAGTVQGIVERHDPESHLLPLVASAIRQGHSPKIFGTDYPTPDGTAIRDYIHIEDLVDVHRKAADFLARGEESQAFNVGSGRGHSVREVIEAFQRVLGRPVVAKELPRREGDPPVLVADISKARERLGFHPSHSQEIDRAVRDVWEATEGPG